MRISASFCLYWWITQIVFTNGFIINQKTHNPLPSTIAASSLSRFPASSYRPSARCVRLQDDNSSSSAIPSSKRSSLRQLISRLAVRRRLRRRSAAVLLAAVVWTTARPAAQAKFSYELNETPTHSLRPGMSKAQADQLEEGELNVEELESASVFQQPAEAAATATKQQKQAGFGYGEDDEDDDDDFLYEEEPSGVASQADQATAQKLQAQTSKEFAAYQQGRSKSLTIKVGLCFFVPTYGFMIVREYVRRRREETYVQKGLEILEAQKAEYFNVTAKSDDSDVQDELKGLKKNATGTDDDDDDDDDDTDDDEDDEDDDDDEDKPPRPSRGDGKPKRPSGGGSGGDDESGDPGYGKPSDEDLDRLNKMFGKS